MVAFPTRAPYTQQDPTTKNTSNKQLQRNKGRGSLHYAPSHGCLFKGTHTIGGFLFWILLQTTTKGHPHSFWGAPLFRGSKGKPEDNTEIHCGTTLNPFDLDTRFFVSLREPPSPPIPPPAPAIPRPPPYFGDLKTWPFSRPSWHQGEAGVRRGRQRARGAQSRRRRFWAQEAVGDGRLIWHIARTVSEKGVDPKPDTCIYIYMPGVSMTR